MAHERSKGCSMKDGFINIDAMTSSRMKCLSCIGDGNHRRAIRQYRKHLAMYPQDNLARVEMLCAQILSSNNNARTLIDAIPKKDTSPELMARMLTAEAYIKVMARNDQGAGEDLSKAKDLDPQFGLPFLSIGRYELLARGDTAKARGLLATAMRLMPASIGPLLPLVQVELEEGKYQFARKMAWRILRRFPFRPKALLAFLWAAVLSTPLKGRLIYSAAVAGIFLPYAGPIILCIWALLALMSFILLRRTVPYLALLPVVVMPAMLAALLARWLLWGRIYP
jgi:tetratricopeptide (TPR) repeat protein